MLRTHAHQSEYSPSVTSAPCRNCGTPLAGPYCSHCGQEDRDPDPSVRELVAEVVSEQLGVDGKLFATFRRLLLAPGQLTLDYLAGRRASFVSPIRLYLVCSVLFFAVASVVPEPTRAIGDSLQREHVAADDVALDRLIAARIDALRRDPSALKQRLGENLAKQRTHQAELKRWKADVLPKLMFVLVPAFAVLTAIMLPRRRRLPAHLAFALHVHAFAFLALLLSQAGIAADRLDTILAGALVSTALMVGYLVLAMRRAYALSAWSALLRSCALGLAYWIVLSLAEALATAVRAELL